MMKLLKRGDETITFPLPAWENISNPTLEQMQGLGFVEFVPEPPQPEPIVIPTSVTMRQARLQLSVLGQYSTVNAAVSSMGEQAEIEWEYATTVDRDNALTAAMVGLLGWTSQQTDDYFLAASKL